MKIVTPRRFASIAGTTSRAARKAPNVLTRHVFSKVLGFVAISGPNGAHRGVVQQYVASAQIGAYALERSVEVFGLADVGRHGYHGPA